MPCGLSHVGRRCARSRRAASPYDAGDNEAAARSSSVYDSCGTNPTSSIGQYESQALPTTFPTGTGPNTRESDELLR
jgi:hypothetical protein